MFHLHGVNHLCALMTHAPGPALKVGGPVLSFNYVFRSFNNMARPFLLTVFNLKTGLTAEWCSPLSYNSYHMTSNCWHTLVLPFHL